MSADPKELIKLFDAKVESFESPTGTRFHALLPFREGILRLRAKKASCRTIVALLKQLGVTVSHNTVARFCREQCAPPASNGSHRKPAAPIPPKPQPPAVAEMLSLRHEGGKLPTPESNPRGRGPRIADPRNV